MSILVFVIVLLALIVIHELGHFFAAKYFKVRVDEFGIGFPPRARLLARRGETEYTLNWLPFGGFVKIYGEDPQVTPDLGFDAARSLAHKPKYVQALVIVAGVAMNIIAAWFLFSIAFLVGVPGSTSSYDPVYVSNPNLVVTSVLEGSPADEGGLVVGDKLVDIHAGSTYADLNPEAASAFIRLHSSEEIVLTYARDDVLETVTLTPVPGLILTEPGRAALGISMDSVGTVRLPLLRALFEAGLHTINLLGAITQAMVGFIASAFVLSADLSDVSGPVGIAGAASQALSLGIVPLLIFAGIISLHLAVINLLPIPALDGGRLFFLLIEKIKGSPIRPAVVRLLNTGSFFVLIALMVLITVSDIGKIVGS